jgi:hypothetical protein
VLLAGPERPPDAVNELQLDCTCCLFELAFSADLIIVVGSVIRSSNLYGRRVKLYGHRVRSGRAAPTLKMFFS